MANPTFKCPHLDEHKELTNSDDIPKTWTDSASKKADDTVYFIPPEYVDEFTGLGI